MHERWIQAATRWRLIVIAIWIGIAVVGAIAATRLPDLLTTSLAVPGSASQEADALLAAHFAENTEGSFTVVYRVTRPSQRTIRRLDRHLTAVRERYRPPTLRN